MTDWTSGGAIPVDDAAVDDPPTVDDVIEQQRIHHPEQAVVWPTSGPGSGRSVIPSAVDHDLVALARAAAASNTDPPLRATSRLASTDSTTGGDDILDRLERDHREVETQFAGTALLRGPERLDAIRAIVHALTSHAAVEEQVVYPAIAETMVGGDQLTGHAVDEHRAMHELLTWLDRMGADDEHDVDGTAALKVLRRLQLAVQAHVMVEEAVVFPAFRTVASPESLADLLARADAVRAAESSRPSEAPSSHSARSGSNKQQPGKRSSTSGSRPSSQKGT
jgi:hemerythrin superfamily protein